MLAVSCQMTVYTKLITPPAARHFFVQSDKETKQRKRFHRSTLSVHSVQFSFIGAPKARCSPEPPMCEPLLLANPDTNTLRPVRSRASTSVPRTGTASPAFNASFVGRLAERFALKGPRGQLRNHGLMCIYRFSLW